MIVAFASLLIQALTLLAVGGISTASMAAPRGDSAPVDDHGQALRLAARPERIVSLAPHTTELLFAAGAGSRVIAVDPASDFPVAATQLPRVSAWPRPDLEALRGAAPDLVLVWGAGLRAEQRESIARIAPVWVSEPARLEAIPHALRQLGRLVGEPEAAGLEADHFSHRMGALRAGVAQGARVRVFYQAWARPLITVSNRDLIGDAIRFCGGQNVFGNEALAARQVDPEAVRAARPQLVVLGDGSTADAPGGESLERWRNRWIAPAPVVVAIAPDLLQRPTPRVLDGVERLCDAIRNVARNTAGHSPVAVNGSVGSVSAMQRVRAEGWR
jgi:iron complex transport system substrate-binding protein